VDLLLSSGVVDLSDLVTALKECPDAVKGDLDDGAGDDDGGDDDDDDYHDDDDDDDDEGPMTNDEGTVPRATCCRKCSSRRR